MFSRKPSTTEVAERPDRGEKYAAHLADMTRRMAAKVAAAQEIGPLPPVLDPELRESCRFNLQLFAEKIVPGLFKGVTKKWGVFHLKAFEILQDAILKGGLFAIAIPRGSGKSAMIKAAIIWAAVYGHCKFAVVVCATSKAATLFLKSIKTQLRGAKAFYDNFPEVAFPIRKLENKASKANGQKFDGVRTAIEWGREHIVLPTIPGSAASGFKVAISGITGSGLRGLVDGLEDGTEVRPDIVIIDDFQTKTSARSPTQTKTRLEMIRGDILGMGGPGEKMSVFVAATVIEYQDGADQLLADPEWQGMRYGVLTKFPDKDAMDHWHKYNEIRLESKAQKRGHDDEIQYYLAHQSAMDGTWEATWPDRFNGESEVTAIQHAMNLYFTQQPKAFFAEFMNTPEAANETELFKVDAKEVCNRLSRVERYEVPMGFEKLTMHIDVSETLLWYMLTAWRNDFTGSIIDYGWYPDQDGRRNFNLATLTRTMQMASGCHAVDVDGAVSFCLQRIGEKVLDRRYFREDKLPMHISKCIIDINYKLSTDAVGRFCRTSKWSQILLPARGWALNEKRRTRISEWAPKEGQTFPRPAERPECEWMLTSPRSHQLQECRFDTNHWKGRMIKALSLPLHSSGSISLYGSDPLEHTMLGEHLASHYALPKTYGDVKDIAYLIRPGITRDDLLDDLVGCGVGASIEEIKLNTERVISDIAAQGDRRMASFPEHMIVRRGR